MAQHLADRAIGYHGPILVDQLEREQVNVELPSFLSLPNKGTKQEPCTDADFENKLVTFIARKADILFKERDTEGVKPLMLDDDEVGDLYAIVPPLEAYLEVPEHLRREYFFKSVQEGDIVIGTVTSILEVGIIVTLTCTDCNLTRQIDTLNIQVTCSVRELPQDFPHESPIKSFAIKDLIRGVVLDVPRSPEKVAISMLASALPADKRHIKLGNITEEDLPVHYLRLRRMESPTYGAHLQRRLGFSNPSNIEYLCGVLGIPEEPPLSLMRGLSKISYPKSQYAEHLRKTQSYKWSLKSVTEGISRFKEGRHVEAMQYLNRALDIDVENVEAMVARGALYANNESYSRALEDFEKALKLNPNHRNAQKYTCETLVAYARSLMDAGDEEAARVHLDHALEINPTMEEARRALRHLQARPVTTQKDSVVEISSDDGEANRSVRVRHDSHSQSEPKTSLEKTSETLRQLIEDEKSSKLKKMKRRRSGQYSDDLDVYVDRVEDSSAKRRISRESDDLSLKRSRHSSREDQEKSTLYRTPGSDELRYVASKAPQDRPRKVSESFTEDQGSKRRLSVLGTETSPIRHRELRTQQSPDNHQGKHSPEDQRDQKGGDYSPKRHSRVRYYPRESRSGDYSPEQHRSGHYSPEQHRSGHYSPADRGQYSRDYKKEHHQGLQDDDRYQRKSRKRPRTRDSSESSSSESSSSDSRSRSSSSSSSYSDRDREKRYAKRSSRDHHRSNSRNSSRSPENSSFSRRSVSYERDRILGNRKNVATLNFRIAEQVQAEQKRISQEQARSKNGNRMRKSKDTESERSTSYSTSISSRSSSSDRQRTGRLLHSPAPRHESRYSSSPELAPLKEHPKAGQSTHASESDARHKVSDIDSVGRIHKGNAVDDKKSEESLYSQSYIHKKRTVDCTAGSPREVRTVCVVRPIGESHGVHAVKQQQPLLPLPFSGEVEGTLKNGGRISGSHGDIDYRPQVPSNLIQVVSDKQSSGSAAGDGQNREWEGQDKYSQQDPRPPWERGFGGHSSQRQLHPGENMHEQHRGPPPSIPMPGLSPDHQIAEAGEENRPTEFVGHMGLKSLTNKWVVEQKELGPKKQVLRKTNLGEVTPEERYEGRHKPGGKYSREVSVERRGSRAQEEYDLHHVGKQGTQEKTRSRKISHNRDNTSSDTSESSTSTSSRSSSEKQEVQRPSGSKDNKVKTVDAKGESIVKDVGEDLRVGSHRKTSLVGYDDEEETSKSMLRDTQKSGTGSTEKPDGNPDSKETPSKDKDHNLKKVGAQSKNDKTSSAKKTGKRSMKAETVDSLQFGKWDSPTEMGQKKDAQDDKSSESLADMEKFLFTLKQKKKEQTDKEVQSATKPAYKRW